MDATASRRMQDLPPKGGYAPIQTARIKLRSVIGAKSIFGFFFASTCIGWYGYYLTHLKVRRDQIEMRSARNAIMPALLAEQDRAILIHMRRNRDMETELMKNVEGWEVGKYYGEPIFFLDEEDQWRDPIYYEYFAHVSPNILDARTLRHLIT
ncbi:hypothetical protein DMN91_002714 [Ooceraea biroi]|uniref:NADH dehydrogenase [ubiquinone] 1 alpha subcomplex subunit 13 n=1 Tax=Ooceraea biroi TaxID=2015173 RepID=A0A026WNX7_OOCBI|nr:NADH dehydrogenase [ubiquinone] 1 alpha subcomplex subunit 13 [Ooceraea biroi]EZA57762.1 NADH dehydrogenase [ubiquinone] 1 alpha subcomplex subunit [Ooceraea biroi]RLU24625.1 hypothetical protein DMN91_002714 [Ooceraea biroi]